MLQFAVLFISLAVFLLWTWLVAREYPVLEVGVIRCGRWPYSGLIVALLLGLAACDGSEGADNTLVDEVLDSLGYSLPPPASLPDTIFVYVDASGSMRGFVSQNSESKSPYSHFLEFMASKPWGDQAVLPYAACTDVVPLDVSRGLFDAANDEGRYFDTAGFYNCGWTPLDDMIGAFCDSGSSKRALVFVTDMVNSRPVENGAAACNWAAPARRIREYAQQGDWQMIAFKSPFEGAYFIESARVRGGDVKKLSITESVDRPIYALVFAGQRGQARMITAPMLSSTLSSRWNRDLHILALGNSSVKLSLDSVDAFVDDTSAYTPPNCFDLWGVDDLNRNVVSLVWKRQFSPDALSSLYLRLRLRLDEYYRDEGLGHNSAEKLVAEPRFELFEVQDSEGEDSCRFRPLGELSTETTWLGSADSSGPSSDVTIPIRVDISMPDWMKSRKVYVIRCTFFAAGCTLSELDWVEEWSTVSDSRKADIDKTLNLEQTVEAVLRADVTPDTLMTALFLINAE